MAPLSADQGWFLLSIEGGPDFGIYRLEGHEKLNEPYEFRIEVVSRDANIDLTGLLGHKAFLTMADRSGFRRPVHGSIRKAEHLHTANTFSHYELWLVPRLWYLGLNQNHRIFQHQSVVEIIRQILKEQGFTFEMTSWKLRETYEEREYCVQYGESDLYFISRLCEEEGIYFYFEHCADFHTLCFSDASGGPWIAGKPEGLVRYFPGSGQVADGTVINFMDVRRRINSDRASYEEWNFETPDVDLASSQNEPDHQKAPAPGGLKLETYQFPHLYDNTGEGGRYAAIQLKRQLTFTKWVEGRGDLRNLQPGHSFSVYEHPFPEANAEWWLTEVRHHGEQPQVLEHEAPDRGFVYGSDFVAIPFQTRFIPEIKHPKKRIDGLQSAIVTGPGEEVYVDEYGRVKVHFHWDRLGPMTDESTRWVRVADGWAGQNFGFIQAPREGQEVLVEFMEGDPDRPVVTGRVYNADNMPPWELPAQKTLSGIQSREFQGERRNQIVFDDTPKEVQIQAASDHALSQVALGYLTRVDHVKGRGDFRGEGFELRTDAWGAIRAAKGLFVTTHPRPKAQAHHKDMTETVSDLERLAQQHQDQADQAAAHNAQPDEPGESGPALAKQASEIKGGGPNQEMARPHLLASAPAGMEFATPGPIHTGAEEELAITAGRNITQATGGSLAISALRRVSLFAYEAGMKLFANQGKVEIQAQSDDLDVIARNVLQIISAKDKIRISAPKEILVTGGGSYFKIDAGGVEFGTSGNFTAHAAKHIFTGPKSLSPLALAFKNAKPVCEVCEAAKKKQQ